MKYFIKPFIALMLTLTPIFIGVLLSGCNSKSVTITQEEYNKLKGDTVKSEYPKKVFIKDTEFEVWKGSDSCEYFFGYATYHVATQYFEHYPLCNNPKHWRGDGAVLPYRQSKPN